MPSWSPLSGWVPTNLESPHEPRAHTERAFEDRVEHELLEQGWEQTQGAYRPDLALDRVRFIGATQQKKRDKLIELYGSDQPTTQRQFAQRRASEIDARGVLDVPRQGVKDKGVAIDLAYFCPGHTLAADAAHDLHLSNSLLDKLDYSAGPGWRAGHQVMNLWPGAGIRAASSGA